MVSGPNLQQQLQAKVQEVKQAVAGLNEDQAQKPPADGEWCAKDVLAHLTNGETAVQMYEMNRFLEESTPDLGLTPGTISEEAARSNSTQQLLSKFETQYAELGMFFAGLSEDQMSRKAHIPFLKETPLGEYPTLGQWAGAIVNFHLADHIQQLRNCSQ
jgi:hypothetical protein